MSETYKEQPRAFAVMFSRLHRWSVGSFVATDWNWPAEDIKPLSSVLTRKTVEVDRTKMPFSDLQLVTLHFDGEMEPRDLGGREDFKGRLFFADPGDVIYSKIDVRNGAIGVVPPEMGRIAVSSEYPVYSVKHGAAEAEYIKLLFRTDAFRRQINSMISGASGRKRVQPSDLEAIEVPLPHSQNQQVIISRWKRAKNNFDVILKKAERLRSDIDAGFLQKLGLKPPTQASLPQALGVWWHDLDRWGVSFNQQRLAGMDLSQGLYKVAELGSLLTVLQYGTSQKANTAAQGTPVIRMNNIKDGTIDLRDLKHVILPPRERASLLLAQGDILINRTNSKELVGKCAVFDKDGDYVFASYLIRLRLDTNKAAPDFVSFVINGPVGRQQINAVSRQIIGQANINTGEIRSLQIPGPAPTNLLIRQGLA